MTDSAPNEIEELPLASRFQRLVGAVIDGFLGTGFSLVLIIASGDLAAIIAGDIPSLGKRMGYLLAGFLFFLVAHGWLLATRGQTIGKLIVGTRIVSVHTNQILPLSMVIPARYMVFWVFEQLPGLGPFVALIDALYIFRPDKRCLHDLVAHTKVVTIR